MAIDPLSHATLVARRNLLAASVAAITYKGFNVDIQSISLFGAEARFDRGAIAFLLIATTAWFTVHFAFRFFIDMKNLDPTPHQITTKESVFNARQNLRQSAQNGLATAIAETLAAGYSLGGSEWPAGHILFEKCEQFGFTIDEQMLYLGDEQRSTLKINALGDPNRVGTLDPVANRDIYEAPIAAMLRYLKGYQRRYRLLWLRQQPVLFWVGSLYIVSNYMIEGGVPLALGILALAAMYDHATLTWVKALLPLSVR